MKKIMLLLLTLALALAFGGCGQEPQQIAIIGGADGPTTIYLSGKSELTPVTLVLDWTPNVNHLGLYAAQALGYYAAAGLDVTIIQPGDNYALQLVAAGQAQFGVSYQEEVTFARDTAIPVLSIAALIPHNTSCFAAPTSHNIHSVSDFAGKKYAGWGGQVEEALLNYLLDEAGLDRAELVNIGSSDFFSAMESGFDFSWIFYQVTGIEAELRGVKLDTVWLTDLDAAFDYYTPVLVAEEGWLAENPQLAQAFLTATAQGYAHAQSDPAGAAQLLLNECPELDAELVSAGAVWLADRWQEPDKDWGWQELSVWQNFSQWLRERGLISADFQPQLAFSNEYLPE